MSSRIVLATFSSACALMVPVACQAETIALLCSGVAAATARETTIGQATVTNGTQVQGSATTYYRERTAEVVTVELDGEGGRIRVPSALLPPINGGGASGWWPLERISVSTSEISGRFTLNFLNKPEINIDRRTGRLSIRGFGGLAFDGNCEKLDVSPEARRF